MPAPGPGMTSGLSGFVGGGKTPKTHRVVQQRAYESAGGSGDYRKVGDRKTSRTRQMVGGVSREMSAAARAGMMAEPMQAGLHWGAIAAAAPLVIGGIADVMHQDWGFFQNGGGGTFPQIEPGGVPFEGPGLREPSADYVVKEWKRRIDSVDGDYNLQYYLVKMPSRPYRIYMYSQRTGAWKSWGLPRPAVIGKNMPSHKMLTRLRRNLKKQVADAKTILMIGSPTGYAKQLGYRKYKKRR